MQAAFKRPARHRKSSLHFIDMECAGCFFSRAILAGLFHVHIAGFHEALVPRQGFVQQMRRVQAARFFCAVEIVVQLVAVIRVRAVVDDEACALAG